MKTLLASLFIAAMVCTAQSPQPAEAADPARSGDAPPLASVADGQQKQLCTITGTVIDRTSREPVSKAKITILGTGFSAQTSDDGQYTIGSIPDGIYQIKAEAANYEPEFANNVAIGEEKKSDRVFFTLTKSAKEEPAEFIPVQKFPVPIKGQTPSAVYPELARRAGIEGMVWVKLWVDEQGKTKKAVVTKSDNEVLNQASIDAAMQWKFEPAILQDKPVAVWITLPFKFKLDKDASVKTDGAKKQKPPVKKPNARP